MTKKELIDRGYIDQYVLGLTTEEENTEVERIANLYPEIQTLINSARHRLCSNFNRNLTQPALRNSLRTNRKVLLWSALVFGFFAIGFFFLCREHMYLQEHYTMQCEQLALEQAKVIQLASFSRMANEQADFLNAPGTKRVKLEGNHHFPDAEAMVFHCENSGKIMLRVIDLPKLSQGLHYEVWASEENGKKAMIGSLISPVRFDSLYSLDPIFRWDALEITSVDPYMMSNAIVCATPLSK